MATQQTTTNVDHPDFEVHNFTTLGLRTGYSRFQIHNLFHDGKIAVLATNASNWNNLLVVAKPEIERIKAQFNARQLRIETSQALREQVRAMQEEEQRKREAAASNAKPKQRKKSRQREHDNNTNAS